MHSASRRAILWAESPAFFLAAPCVLKTRYALSATRMAHRLHHRAARVRREVRDLVRDAVRGKSLPGCSFWAAGARPIRIPGRAAALMLRKAATGLRALGLKPASLLRIAQASLPVPRSHRAPAGQGQNQNLRGGDLRIGLRALGHTPFPKTPACAPAPDWRPIPSLRSVIPQAASRARFALDQAPHRSRLGPLPLLSLVGTRSCLYRDRISQRSGASFTLRRLGAAYHGSPALWGPAQTSLKPRSSCCIRSRLLGHPSLCFTARAACARPKTRRVLGQTTDRRISSWVTNILQSAIKFHQGVNQSSCLSLN
jgi:hypothetical protein